MAVLLLAEDDEDIALIMSRVLKRVGFAVFHAPDGQAALDMAVEHRPEVLLTDLGMPRLDGLQLCRAIRTHAELSRTPVAILSGSLLPGDPRAAEVQACAALLKPCVNDLLVAAMQRLTDYGPHDHDGVPSACPLGLA